MAASIVEAAGRFAAAAGIAAALAACAAEPCEPAAEAVDPADPLEPVNRNILEANQIFDRILLKPLAQGYVAIVPEDGRDALRRVLDNMKEPTAFFNNALQGEFERAGITAGRLVVNTTVGLAGIVDVAKDWGLPRQPADFGQTLYVWGMPSGPYLVLPIVGPSNPRDALGMGIDAYADPTSLLAKIDAIDEITIARFVADGFDQRGRFLDVLDDLEKNSLDFYAQLKSLSQQRRASELRHGAAPAPASDFYEDPGQAAPGAADGSAPPKL
jgi:phospholipid-binding lipoprotein MlaA